MFTGLYDFSYPFFIVIFFVYTLNMTQNFSFYSNPFEDKYIPTEEEMERERLLEIEWEEHQKEQYYRKLYEKEFSKEKE